MDIYLTRECKTTLIRNEGFHSLVALQNHLKDDLKEPLGEQEQA